MLLQPQQPAAGQDLPGATSSTGSTPPAATAQTTTLSSAQFASDTLSSLLSAQEAPPSASGVAAKIISVADTNGDGSLSLSEIEKAIGADTTSGSDTASGTDPLSAAFAKLDTNGDGEISATELTNDLSAQNAAQQGAQGPQGAHHHHHHGGGGGGMSGAGGASSTDLASQILGTADTNSDGQLSMTEIENALGVTSSSSTTATNALTSAFNSLDSNGDGSLSASELSAGIDAFRAAHHRGGAETAQSNPATVSA
ncbi:EF-hand domain-containing protein [Phenylobacterium sp.]|jgi:Ca2+-binding EF-hand superfamily protein|uniref:EF-hand domain-containing protein n=1 Tax=Phenylobacterium sp. TaxID=1871053 RepID=UPI002E373DF4|nr:EF-hand domain-containing protein [Phenylobacterium sp.]HEX3366309.1 EF-hand domain-containing protein [Phenylobacterium sp.]